MEGSAVGGRGLLRALPSISLPITRDAPRPRPFRAVTDPLDRPELTSAPDPEQLPLGMYEGVPLVPVETVGPDDEVVIIPVREPPFETTGTIVWCRLVNSHYDVGVQFADANTEFSVRMIEQICHIQRYRKEVLEQGRQLSEAEAALEWVTKYAKDFPT